jgi:peptide-O-fucosyltransferase
MFDRAEVILWDSYGGVEWWKARKSLQFSEKLAGRAESYLKRTFPSFERPEKVSESKGGPFVGVHIRRQDFLFGRRNTLPSLQGSVIQLIKIAKRLKLGAIFLASDASVEGWCNTDVSKIHILLCCALQSLSRFKCKM